MLLKRIKKLLMQADWTWAYSVAIVLLAALTLLDGCEQHSSAQFLQRELLISSKVKTI